jgi:threonine/homoserine/homoserine lactone efflux protein
VAPWRVRGGSSGRALTPESPVKVSWTGTAAGVLYLAWLASATLRPGGNGLFETQSHARDSRSKLFRMGLVTNLLNPKAAVM